MAYNEEELLTNIEQTLTDFNFEQDVEESKQNLLNKLNSLLFPMKDSGTIADYQFLVKKTDDANEIQLTVFVKASEDEVEQGWDFTITNGSK